MATLVQFLASGVNGAANGSATFLLRGTASSAQSVMYNEFEAITQPASNVVTLDANGAAEVYVEAYVDVTLRTSSGDILRTVTVGNSAPLVEVQSTSFTGTDYDGSPANTAGEPITLKAILDRWIDSAGAPDWQVLFGGVATNIESAIAGFSGMFVNVKDPAYGALGDGVTDDTTAITAAITAAAGGIVFFPPGTYKTNGLTISTANVNLWGSGAGSSIISGSTGTSLIALTNNSNTNHKNFRGLSFTSSGAFDRLFLLEESQNVSFVGCSFDASQCSADVVNAGAAAGLSKFRFSDCDFTLGASTLRGLYNSAATGARMFTLQGCDFKVPSGFTGSIIVGADFMVDSSRFDGSAVTSGTYRHVDAVDQTAAGKYVGSFTNNQFRDGGSSGFAFKLTSLGSSCDFNEEGNTFIGFATPDATTEKGQTYEITDADSGVPGDIHLGSRKGRTIHVTNNAGTFTASMCLEAEHVVIEHTLDANLTVTVPHLIPGLSGRVVVFLAATATAARTIEFDGAPAYSSSVSQIRCSDVTNGNLFGIIEDDQSCSCGYVTTVRADGEFRSLICGIFNHDVAV